MKLLSNIYIFLSGTRVQKILFPVILVVTFILIYLLNRLYPLFAEDWDYRFIWEFEKWEPNKINSLSDIIQSQYNHYMLWGGRSIVHAIDQLLLMFGTGLSDLINSMAFVGFVYMIYTLANIGKSRNIFVFIVAALGIWLAQPAFPTTVLWLTGSANYLWGTLIIILFIYPFCRYFYEQKESYNVTAKSVFLFIGGVFAGWTNENMSVALIFFLIVLLIVMKSRKILIPKWAISGLAGAIIGCGFLLLAPGNFARLAHVSPHEAAETVSFISTLGARLSVLFSHFRNHLLIPSVIYLSVLFVFVRTTSKRKRDKTLYLSLLFFATAYVAHLAMIATPTYPQRALFGLISFIIIAILILYANIEMETTVFRLANLLVVLVITCSFAIEYYRDYRYLTLVDKFWKERAVFVEQEKEKGKKDIIFEDHFDIYKSDFEFYDFASFPNNWFNNAYARYYGVNSVRVKAKEEINRK